MNKRCPNCAKEVEEWRDICPSCFFEFEDKIVGSDGCNSNEKSKITENIAPAYSVVKDIANKNQNNDSEYVYSKKVCGLITIIAAVFAIIFAICKVMVPVSDIDANIFGIFEWIFRAIFIVSLICTIINAKLVKMDKRMRALEKENENLRNQSNTK